MIKHVKTTIPNSQELHEYVTKQSSITSVLDIIKEETNKNNKRIYLLEKNQKRNNWINKRRCL